MLRFSVTILAIVLLSAVGRTQDVASLHPLQPADTSSPAATLNSLIDSCNELQKLVAAGAVVEEREAEVLPVTERILDCLDLSGLPAELRGSAGVQSGLFLKEVLDRIDLPDDAEIPAVNPEVGSSRLAAKLADSSNPHGDRAQRTGAASKRVPVYCGNGASGG